MDEIGKKEKHSKQICVQRDLKSSDKRIMLSVFAKRVKHRVKNQTAKSSNHYFYQR
jgi:hypothetical protein